MKKLIGILMMLIVVCVTWGQFAGGSGTEADPWQITTAAQLNNVRNYLGSDHADKYFKLMNDIDLTAFLSEGGDGYSLWGESGWLPIGGSTSASHFRGYFNGNGKTITGLIINRSSVEYIGLFAYASYGATIENLGLTAAQVNGKYRVGALVGAINDGIIDNCYAEGTVNAIYNVGGLIGQVIGMNSVITNSHTNASVNGSDNNIGGLIGITSLKSTISNCYSIGNVTGSGNSNVGGLVGYNYSNIADCYATGEVTGNNQYGTYNVGGLTGTNQQANIEQSYSTGNVTASGSVGGLVGSNDRGNQSNNHASGSVSGNSNIGGLIGTNYSSSFSGDIIITGCYAIGNVTGTQKTGGLIGYNYEHSNRLFIRNCYSTGSVTRSEGSYENFGGFIGNNSFTSETKPCVIEYCYSVGKIFSSSGIIWNEGGVKNKGFVGLSEGNYVTYNNNFFDSALSEQTSGVGAESKSTAEMKQKTTFTNSGWDFDLIWDIGELSLAYYSYPYLLNNQQSPPPGLEQIFSGGTGEQHDPWQISTSGQLNSVRNFIGDSHSDKYFILNNDIDLTAYLLADGYNNGALWNPIGDNTDQFKGHFNGNKFKVTGLQINRPASDDVGLFGYIGSGAAISYLGVEIVESTSVTGKDHVGGLAGQNHGTVGKCYIGGAGLVSGNQSVGSLCGLNNGSVSETYTNTAVSAILEAGGFAGKNTGTIENAFSTGAVSRISGESGDIGGFCGLCDGSTIQRCYSSGSVTYTGASDPDNKGFSGSVSGSNTFSGNYFDLTSSAQTNATQAVPAAASAKTGAQMRQQDTFSGWNFSTIWDILEGQIRPFLSWEWEGVTLDGLIPVRSMSYNSGNVTYSGGIDMNDDEVPDVNVSFTAGEGSAETSLSFKYAEDSNISSVQLFVNPEDIGAYYRFEFDNDDVLINGQSYDLELPYIPNDIWYRQPGGEWQVVPSFSGGFGKAAAPGSVSYIIDATQLTYDESGSGVIEFASDNGGDMALPIRLRDFSAICQNGAILLSWQTASETNNARFLIYRNDVVIGSVEGAGTTNKPHSYTFIDDAVIPGIVYTYVLADVDYANKVTKYEMDAVTVTFANDFAEADFVVGAAYPNPFNPRTIVPVELLCDATVKASLYDLSGREVKALVNTNFTSGTHELRIDGAGLATGLYLVQVVINDVISVQKIALMK